MVAAPEAVGHEQPNANSCKFNTQPIVLSQAQSKWVFGPLHILRTTWLSWIFSSEEFNHEGIEVHDDMLDEPDASNSLLFGQELTLL